jgi:hypothetical protein
MVPYRAAKKDQKEEKAGERRYYDARLFQSVVHGETFAALSESG